MADQLFSLAVREFGRIAKAEQILISSVTIGEVANYNRVTAVENARAFTCPWGEDRIIRGEFLRWLCADSRAVELVDKRGLQIIGATILGSLDLSFLTIPFRVALQACCIPAGMDISFSRLPYLQLNFSRCGSIDVSGAALEGALSIEHGILEGQLRTVHTRIAGNLELNESRITIPLKTMSSRQEVHCIAGDGIAVAGSINLANFVTINSGEIRFQGAKNGRQFFCGGARLIQPAGTALRLDGSTIGEGIYLTHRFQAQGTVRMIGVVIDGELDCSGASLSHPAPGDAVMLAERIKAGDNVRLSQSNALGRVSFHRAVIKGQFLYDGGRLVNPRKVALILQGAKVEGQVNLGDGLEVLGSIHLENAELLQGIYFRGGRFMHPGTDGFDRPTSIQAQGLRVTGHVFFDPMRPSGNCFYCEGFVLLEFAEIQGAIDFDRAEFKSNDVVGIGASGLRSTGPLRISNLQIAGDFILDLTNARVSGLERGSAVQLLGNYRIDGLEYSSVPRIPASHLERRQWLEDEVTWIQGQDEGVFASQPYQHFADLLRGTGHIDESRAVEIARQEAIRTSGDLPWQTRTKMRFWSFTLRYGYEPWRPFLWVGLPMILVGAFWYWWGFNEGYFVSTAETPGGMAATSEGHDPANLIPWFNPIVFSLDAFVPIIDFGQQSNWQPSGEYRAGWWMLIYFWFEVAVGWACSTLFVLGLTGIVRQE